MDSKQESIPTKTCTFFSPIELIIEPKHSSRYCVFRYVDIIIVSSYMDVESIEFFILIFQSKSLTLKFVFEKMFGFVSKYDSLA